MGVFTSTVLLSMAIQYFQQYGFFAAIMIYVAIAFITFKYVAKNSKIRLIIWGMIGTIALVGLIYIFFIISLKKSLEGF